MDILNLTDGTLCTLIGPPGCGKSDFAARYPDSWRVCLDTYRNLATDDFPNKTCRGSIRQTRCLVAADG
ncbi:hypothetical protein ACFXPY_34140 [Streptomyces sp. NPDC059153]|uniref:hypothetical protein n=1 Tax=unclassified Streptomyces TaxID=2593676 RepID=UPI003631CF64